MSAIMKQVLDAACENGDLTRAGVVNAFNELQDVDTGGLVVPTDGFETGRSPSLKSLILRPAEVPGGATLVKDAFGGELAGGLRCPSGRSEERRVGKEGRSGRRRYH